MRYRRCEVVRPVRKRVLILCEGGKTEPNYFAALKADKMISKRLSALRIELHKTKINTAKELVDLAIRLKKEAERERNPFDEVWVVFDRDGYTKHPQSFDRAKAKDIKVAFSSACFEFWILLHFEYTTAPFANCDEVIQRLRNHIPDYDKNGDHFPTLRTKIDFAIANGTRVMEHWEEVGQGQIWTFNSYSDVGLLVDKLLKL